MEVERVGVLGRVGQKGRKLYLNNNKIQKYLIKKESECARKYYLLDLAMYSVPFCPSF